MARNPQTPRYYPEGIPRADPLVRLYDIVYELIDSGNAASGGNNAGGNTTNISISGGGGGGGNAVPEVVIGTHAARDGTAAVLYVESDRNNAVYGNNGGGWSLVEAFWEGAFESRYGDLGANDAGGYWTETSRNNVTAIAPLLVHRWNGNNWIYRAGQISRNQNQLTTLFATLGPNDANMEVNVLDFRHQLQWQSNNTTTWGPNDDGRAGEGPIFREIDPSPTTGWKLYDGNNVSYLLPTGNTANTTLPDLTSNNAVAAYLKGGSPNAGPNAATAPVFTGNNLTPTGSISALTFTGTAGNTGNSNATTTFQVGAGANLSVAAQTHGHPFTPAGTINTPTFTGDSVTPTGNVSNNGEPRNLVRRAWFRQ